MQFNESQINLILTNSNNYKNVEEAFEFFCKETSIENEDVASEEFLGEILYIGILIKKNAKSLNKKNIKSWLERSNNYHINADILLVNENNVEISTLSNKIHLLQENYFEPNLKTINKKLIVTRKYIADDSQLGYLKKKNDVKMVNNLESKKRYDEMYNLTKGKNDDQEREKQAGDKQTDGIQTSDKILIDLDNNKPSDEKMEKMFFLNNSPYHIEGLIYVIVLPLTISQKYINKNLILRVQLFENSKKERKVRFPFLNEKREKELKNIIDSPPLLLNNIQWSSTFTSNAIYKKKINKMSNEYDEDDEEYNFFLNVYDGKSYKDSEQNFPLNVNLHNIYKSLNAYNEFMYKNNSKNNYKSLILNKNIIVVKPLNITYKIIDHFLYLKIENITKKNKIEVYELFSRSINIDSSMFPLSLYPEDMYSFFFPIENFAQILSLNNVKKKNSVEMIKQKQIKKSNEDGVLDNKRHSQIIEKYKNNGEVLAFCFNNDKKIISLCLKWCIDDTTNNFIWSQYCIEMEMPSQNLFNLEISFVNEINCSSILIASFSFYNIHHEDIDLAIQILDGNNGNSNCSSNVQPSLISFNSSINVGVISPHQCKSVTVKLLAIMLGLHNFPFVKIKNKFTNKCYLVDLGSILLTE